MFYRAVRTVVVFAGTALTVYSIYFLIRLIAEDGLVANFVLTPQFAIKFFVLGVVPFVASAACVSAAWAVIVRIWFYEFPYLVAIGAHCATQILKYAPLNIFHQLGRAAAMRDRGVPIVSTGVGALLEAAMIVAAALLIGVQFGDQVTILGKTQFYENSHHAGTALALIVTTILMLVALKRKTAWRLLEGVKLKLSEMRDGGFQSLLLILLLYLTSFFISGISTYFLVPEFTGTSLSIAVTPFVAGMSLCWVIGFLTPGSPGGIGVREITIVLLLGPQIGNDAALLAGGVSRVCSMASDIILAAAGAWILYFTKYKRIVPQE